MAGHSYDDNYQDDTVLFASPIILAYGSRDFLQLDDYKENTCERFIEIAKFQAVCKLLSQCSHQICVRKNVCKTIKLKFAGNVKTDPGVKS